MFLIPAAARPWLAPDSRNQPWSGHGAMMIRRRQALDQLYAAYGSWARYAAGGLAWALGLGGAVLVGRGVAAGGEGPGATVGIGLLVLATVLGGAVVATGSSLARAAAAWWTLATAVRADGGRVDATTADPDTRRAHEEAITRDRSAGRGELWRMPLLPRTVAAALLIGAALVLLVQAGLGYEEVSRPYAGDDLRGEWLTRVVLALVCLLGGALTASGLRRVHRARMHRVQHDEPATPAPDTGPLTPALGSGAIVVGGTLPAGAASAPPSWATPLSAASSDLAPAGPAPAASPDPAAGTPAAALSHDGAPAGEVPAAPPAGEVPAAPPAGEVPAAPPAGDVPAAPGAGEVPAAPPAGEVPAALPAGEVPAAPGAGDATGAGPAPTPTPVAPASPGELPATPSSYPSEPAPAVPETVGTGPRVRLSDGRELGLGVTLVGRAPRPRPDEQADDVLPVVDERVSKTHLTVRVEPGRVVVVDRGSTNGTVVHGPHGARTLHPGDPCELADGDVVVIGGTTLTVGEPAEDVEHTVLRER